jgi:predicted DsbA family dithiol-disulfide isomerase
VSVQVEIYSDVVCPWCYIGKRRFEAAVAETGLDVEIVWRPFQLDPTAPREAQPVIEAYAKKFGGPQRAVQIISHMTDVAAGEGLDFHLDTALRANTIDAHRLLDLALRQGGGELQGALKERLLRAYFTESEDVGSHDTLARLAAEVGMDEAEVAAFLASGEGLDELRSELLTALDRGVTAVPTFVFEGQWALPGAQDVDVMVQVLRRVQEKLVPQRVAAEAAACEGDACEV